jgi:hypothetical protein
MSAVRVILITVAGPTGHVDVGVRSDATPEDLADALGGVIGVSRATSVIEHRSPPRPGVPDGGRVLVRPGTVLADVGVADGDLVLFRAAGGAGGFSWPEVQGRPAEFGDGSPPPNAPALSLPAPAPEPALATPAPDAPALNSPAEPPVPDIWPAAAPVGSDVWPAAEPAAPGADPSAAITDPDAAGLPAAMRFVRAPRSGRPVAGHPVAGRHARDQISPADPEPEPDQDITEIWPAVTVEPADGADTTSTTEPDQPWRPRSQEVNTDDWRG